MQTSLSKLLIQQGGVYTLSRLANASIGFVMLPVYAKLLQGEYGVVTVMTSVGSFLGLLFAHGVHAAWFRLRYEFSDKQEVRVFETTLVWYFVGVIGVGTGCLFLVGPWLETLTPGIPFYPYWAWTVLGSGTLVFSSLYERKLQAEERPVAFAWFTGTRTVVTLLAIVLFVVGLNRGALGRIEAGAFAGILFVLPAIALIRPGSPSIFSLSMLKRSVVYGVWLVPHSLAGLAHEMVDRLLVNGMLGIAAAGAYGMGYKIAGVAMIVATSLNQAYTPLFIRTLKESERLDEEGDAEGAEEARTRAVKAGLHLVVAVSCLAIGLAAFGREALVVLNALSEKDYFVESWKVLYPASVGFVALACYYVVVQPVAYDLKLVRWMGAITIGALLVNVGANLVLIPRYGIAGAAYATLISYTAMTLFSLILARWGPSLPRMVSEWTFVLGIFAGGFAVLFAIESGLESIPARVLLKSLVVVIVCGIPSRRTGVFRGLARLFKN